MASKRKNLFRSMMLIDLALLLALVFIGVIQNQHRKAKENTIPVLEKLIAEQQVRHDSLNALVNTLLERLPPSENHEVIRARFETTSLGVSSVLDSLDSEQDSDEKDAFERVEELILAESQMIDQLMQLIEDQNTLLWEYLSETRIERRILGEDLLKFKSGDKDPDPKAQDIDAQLEKIYAIVDSYIAQGYNIVKIIGHTDQDSDYAKNRTLAQDRANYLAGKIRGHLYKGNKKYRSCLVQAVGYGEFDLLPPKEGEDINSVEYKTRNRRVELVFSTQRFEGLVTDC